MVTHAGGDPVKFCEGDRVVFSAGVKCKWSVHKSVRKHYRFSD